MPRKYARKPRRPARKPRRRAPRLALNTKVDQAVVYRSMVKAVSTAWSQGTIANGFYYNYSPQSADVVSVNGNQEFLIQSKLYDEFKVSSMKVTYTPYQTFNASIQPGSITDGLIYTVIDRDGRTPINAGNMQLPQKLMSYDSCKAFHFTKKWSRTVPVKTFWTDCSNPVFSNLAGGASSQPWTNAGCLQQLIIYSEGMPSTGVYGQFTVEWRVQFRGKKTTAWGFDEGTGAVILVPLENFPSLPLSNPPGITLTAPAEITLSVVEGEIVLSDLNGLVPFKEAATH